MAIDMVAAGDYPDELGLTLLHEFAHVFTQTGDQLDIDTGELRSTLWNGRLLVPGSYLDSWVNEFWTDEELLSLPADGSADQEGVSNGAMSTSSSGFTPGVAPRRTSPRHSRRVFDLEVPEGVEPRMAFSTRTRSSSCFACGRCFRVGSRAEPVRTPADARSEPPSASARIRQRYRDLDG